MTRLLLWNLLLALVWALSTGAFTPLNLLVGWLIGMAILRFLRPSPETAGYVRRLGHVVTFALRYAWNVLRSSLEVARHVLAPAGLQPGVVRVPLEARTDTEITLLGNLISFSPGTLCVDVAEDRSEMLVHGMSVEDERGLVEHIRRDLEAPLLRILR